MVVFILNIAINGYYQDWLVKIPTRSIMSVNDLIKRPENLVRANFELEFNFRFFNEVECDLGHINKNERSVFTLSDIVSISQSMLTNVKLAPIAERDFGGEVCSYFRRTGIYKMKKFKLIFCICSDRPETIGIITLHRT
jgi:hypothetical protein